MATNRIPRSCIVGLCLFFLASTLPAQNIPQTTYLFRPTKGIFPGRLALPGPQLLEGIGTLDAGDPILVAPLVYGSGGYIPSSVWIADLNHDGKLDLVVANACNSVDECGQGNVSVLLGNGDGTFQTAVAYNAGSTPSSVTVADVNRDGKPDLIVSDNGGGNNGDGAVAILLGNGDGTFQPPVTYDAGGCYTSSVAVADLNRDGKLDIVLDSPACATNYDGIVGVLLGKGDGTFQPVVTYDSGGDDQGALSSVAVADFNGDGKPDVAISNTCGTAACEFSTMGVLLGNGDGTLQTAVSYSLPMEGATSIAVADVNADGKLDLAVAGSQQAVLLGNGDGTFRTGGTYGSFGVSVKIADINGDGKPDLVYSSSPSYGGVSVLLGNGDGTFQSPSGVNVPYAGQLNSLAVADLNGDGRPDVVVTNDSGLGIPPCYYSCVDVLFNNLGPHTPSTTALASDANPTILKYTLTYTATVTPQSGTATGTVTFMNVDLKGGGSSTIATVPLVNNQAAYDDLPVVGIHYIMALYSGDLHNSSSNSPVLEERVEKATTTTTVSTSSNPSNIGVPVNIVATVTANSGDPLTGSVTFRLKSQYGVLGTTALVNGQATFQYAFTTKGKNPIVAYYNGDNDETPSVSATLSQIVDPAPTTTGLSSSLNPSLDHQAVTFTASVSSSASLVPTGRVTFRDGTKIIGSGTLSGGIATLTKSTLLPGSHSITAAYDGDTSSAKSTSTALTQVVD
ncbi:MAG: FG-GAP-like repeat-containing protein [Terriglobales bacterium]